jgi:hypothetical protein
VVTTILPEEVVTMADLTQGYKGGGKGNTQVLDAILKKKRSLWLSPPGLLASQLFNKVFMPYAKRTWTYDGATCNCEHLARAFIATWDYVRFKRAAKNLPKAEAVKCPGGGLITQAWDALNRTQGNVRTGPGKSLSKHSLFPVHWLCKIGSQYFDPTFYKVTNSPNACIHLKIKKLGRTLWLSVDRSRLYERNLNAAPGFADSWDEFKAEEWVTYDEWKKLTARSGHTRSGKLRLVDEELEAYGKNPGKLQALKDAFKDWYTRNPKEVAKRNTDSCINRLALNLGLAKELLK